MPDFPIWPQCNIGCVFCSNPAEGYRDTTDKYTFDILKKKLADYKAGLKTFVKFDEVDDYFNLTGGEPTAHPEFHKVLAHVRSEFPGTLIRLLSNGRMFAYEDFARRTLGIGLTPFEVAVPMFGGTGPEHEATSRTPKSFEQTTQGLRHLFKHRKPGQRVEIRVIMTKVQVKFLRGLLTFLRAEFPDLDRIVFLGLEIEGFGEVYQERIKLPLSEAAAAIDANFDLVKGFKEARLYHFPLCAVPTRLWPNVWNTLAGFKTTYLEGCRTRCVYKAQCVGVHRSYEAHHAAQGIEPIEHKRAVRESGDRYHPFAAALDRVGA